MGRTELVCIKIYLYFQMGLQHKISDGWMDIFLFLIL